MASYQNKNKKIILLNGFSRGGTNILWNILQSHPQLCSPIQETGDVLYRDLYQHLPARLVRTMFKNGRVFKTPLGTILHRQFDTRLFQRKQENYNHPQNGEKAQSIPYTLAEVEETALCTKSLNADIHLTTYFISHYSEVYVIDLIRDGYAWCNGWLRRGASIERAGKTYANIGQVMRQHTTMRGNYIVIKFEDVLQNPFAIATQLYQFAQLEPITLKQLRLKSKKFVNTTGQHTTNFGEANNKYWFTPETIGELLDSEINKRQIDQLSQANKAVFERYAKPILDYFGYTKTS